MQGRISGFFMTMFMMLPLAAIPLMSVFGVPQIGSFAAFQEEVGFLPEDPLDQSSAPGWNNSSHAAQDSAFENDSAPEFSWASSSSPDSRPVSHVHGGGTENTMHQEFSSQTKLSWDQGLAEMRRYGIHDYRIEGGVQQGSTQFACYLHSPDSQSVIRFEAEAGDPETAMQQTLAQIRQWMQALQR